MLHKYRCKSMRSVQDRNWVKIQTRDRVDTKQTLYTEYQD